MTKLDCCVAGCVYNECNSCKRDHITVGGQEAQRPSETVCKSFALRGTNTLSNVCAGAKKETNVSCDAVHCKFNDGKICKAKNIDIMGARAVTNGETECGSFVSK